MMMTIDTPAHNDDNDDKDDSMDGHDGDEKDDDHGARWQ